MHLSYCMRSADEAGVTGHPQQVMRQLGITYQHATPQSMNDSWWFWNCENIPNPLPVYLSDLKIKDPHDYVGYGLLKEDADAISAYGTPDKYEDCLKQRRMFDAIREHCIYAMYSLVDKADPIERAMDIESFKSRARRCYLGMEHPPKVYNNEFYARVNCLVQAIWEEIRGK